MNINQEIERINKKMALVSHDSPIYMTYLEMLSELKKLVPVTIHKDPNDNLCDGCQ